MMNAHYGKPVILLLDEYDVPLLKQAAMATIKRNAGCDENDDEHISKR